MIPNKAINHSANLNGRVMANPKIINAANASEGK